MSTQEKMSIKDIENRLEEIREERESLLHAASEIKGEYLSTYEIRPAGRHLFTMGENLIQDKYAAIIELVKNSYDADSPDVQIVFRKIPEKDCLEIQVKDHGHGMTTEDIIQKWLVPSTSNKQKNRISPLGRIMQGRKGIGRYAAGTLGDDFTLQTIDKSGNETTLHLQWSELAECEYLDQIRIPIETKKTDNNSGTLLIMRSSLKENDYWTKKAIEKLQFELKKLVPPKTDDINEQEFQIVLTFDNFYADNSSNRSIIIEPYPILEYYDYRISGYISADGFGELLYENQKARNTIAEKIICNYEETKCGSLSFDIRVYDRDKASLDQLVLRGLKDDSTGHYLTSLQARQLLDKVNGIGVYRNGFRIRPLGDAEYDWLELNKIRVQNPSMRIGSNQVAGYIHIQSEEESKLEEKSARDGLKDNVAYAGLIRVTQKVIKELEERRYIFRRKAGLTSSAQKLDQKLDGLYNYEPLKKAVTKAMKQAGITIPVINEITDIITREEHNKNETIEDIKRAVAVYQGQATLGKIVNVILHEGRRPLNYFKNQIPNLRFYRERFIKDKDDDSYNKIIQSANGITENAGIFVNLFGRLDPLSAKRREKKTEFFLCESITGAIAVFNHEFQEKNIKVFLNCPNTLRFTGWKQDIYTIMVNLLDNSVFWIEEKKCEKRDININVIETDSGFNLDYKDSGPGINDDLIESGVIFEPEFSTKPGGGTGLGLAIAGEAATRNNLKLIAVQNDNGAHFLLKYNE